VQEIEIDVIEPQPGEAGVERAPGAVETLVVVPQLGGDEDLGPRQAAGAHRVADVALVAVVLGGVDVAIADAQRFPHRAPGLLAARRQNTPRPRRGISTPLFRRNDVVALVVAGWCATALTPGSSFAAPGPGSAGRPAGNQTRAKL
jgi:hypothetical protein